MLDILPLNHRIEFADVNGDGAVELLAAPVTGGASESYPVYAGTTNLYAYDCRLDWQRSVVSTQTGHLHGMIVADWNGDGRDDALTAGLGGIWLHTASEQAGAPQWSSQQLAHGAFSLQPFGNGSSDIRVGKLQNGQQFMIAPEPWHSGKVFIYLPAGDQLVRYPVELGLDNAHGPAAGDLNNDGLDEIVLGNRTGDTSIYLYYATDQSGTAWQRADLDIGAIGGTNCSIVDMNLDGWNDIVCGGHFTSNLRWYENLGVQ